MTLGLAGLSTMMMIKVMGRHRGSNTCWRRLRQSSARAARAPRRRTPGADRRTTWLDTFDWRLYRAGLTLEFVPGRGGGELRLSGTRTGAPGSDATQLVTGWQASRPHLLADLPAGPVSARIGGILAPRALLPVATASTATHLYRLLNAEGKTVARLLVTRPSLAGREPLPPRLDVTEVRGYLGQARRAARLVAAVPGVRPAVEPLFADALRAIGRRPGDYSNKVDAAITAAMPAGAAAAAILLRSSSTPSTRTWRACSPTRILSSCTTCGSACGGAGARLLFGDAISGVSVYDLAFFAAEFKWVGDLTTPTRT